MTTNVRRTTEANPGKVPHNGMESRPARVVVGGRANGCNSDQADFADQMVDLAHHLRNFYEGSHPKVTFGHWLRSNRAPLMKEFEVEKLQNDIAKAKTRLTIFLAGPSIKPAEEPADELVANKARFKLFKKINEQGDTCTLGEHKELIKIYEEHYKTLANLAFAEFAHVTNGDGVIILPSSPGSFCELGMFAISNVVCLKMLILMDRNHKEKPGYPYLGPAIMARLYGAELEYVDYKNHAAIWSIVEPFLEERRIRKLLSPFRIGQ